MANICSHGKVESQAVGTTTWSAYIVTQMTTKYVKNIWIGRIHDKQFEPQNTTRCDSYEAEKVESMINEQDCERV